MVGASSHFSIKGKEVSFLQLYFAKILKSLLCIPCFLITTFSEDSVLSFCFHLGSILLDSLLITFIVIILNGF